MKVTIPPLNVTEGVLFDHTWDEPESEIIPKSNFQYCCVFTSPNPGRDMFQINIPAEYSGPYKIRIVDMMGRVQRSFATEDRQFTVSELNLPAGPYPVIISGSDFSESFIWVKMD